MERSGEDRRAEHCDMHHSNSETLEAHSNVLSQIKGGLLIASIAISMLGTICGAVITYYVYENSKTMATLSTDLKEIHLVVHNSENIAVSNKVMLEVLDADVKELKGRR